MKKKLLVALSFVLAVVLAITGTVAYFTDTDEAVNVMTVGKVSIKQNEQQRVDDGANQHELEKFEQGKALLPSYYEGTSIPWAAEDEWVVAGEQAWKVVEDTDNVIDKFVTVKNTGNNDAYVRTIFAVEVGPDAVNAPYVHFVNNSTNIKEGATWTWKWLEDDDKDVVVEINNNYYLLWIATYTDELAPGVTTIPSLKQVYLDKTATQEIVEAYGKTYDILALSQAVQADMNGLTAAEALDEAFGKITKDNAADLFTDIAPKEVDTDVDLKTALTAKKKNIVVNLTEDTTYDVAAWSANGMGGEATETITINGNGYTLTFNQTNSDWNNVVTNGAKLILNNVNLTNAGHNDGPWNRHDIVFSCEVEMNNVTSDKAIALKADAELNNVTVDDANTSDTYAIWIAPNGQTVTLDGCTIDMIDCSDGRGIKIDNQYKEDAEKAVTLNVKNTSFKTEEKSAILVKSAVGATINLDNVDISGVAADPFNEVWVDEASAAYADLVTVNGGKKVIEGQYKITTVSSNADFATAVKDGANAIVLSKGNYTMPDGSDVSLRGKVLTIKGDKNTVIDVSHIDERDQFVTGATLAFDGVTLNFGTANYMGFANTASLTYKNCVINGVQHLYGPSITFDNCTLNVSGDYYMVRTWGGKNVTFDDCTFNCDGKALLVYNQSCNLTVNNCVFNDNGDGTISGKAAIEACNGDNGDNCVTHNITVNNTKVNGFDINESGINTGTTLWANKNSLDNDHLNVIVDGKTVY